MILPVELIPTSLSDILSLHDSIDRIFCFVSKRKLPCTLSILCKLYDEDSSTVFLILLIIMTNVEVYFAAGLKLDSLAKLCGLCPKLYTLHLQDQSLDPADIVPNVIELIYSSSCNSPSASHVKARRKEVLTAITSFLMQQLLTQAQTKQGSISCQTKAIGYYIKHKKEWMADLVFFRRGHPIFSRSFAKCH